MAATILAPVGLAPAVTTLQDLTAATPSGKVRRYDLRVSNISGSTDAKADIYLVDTVTPANSHYRAKDYPVPFATAGSAPDLEQGLLLPVGWKIQVRTSIANALAFSATGVEDAA